MPGFLRRALERHRKEGRIMADEKNVMLEAGRGSEDHPLAKQYEVERQIQLRGREDPSNLKMPGGIGTLEDVQRRNLEVQEKEGKKVLKTNREASRNLSFGSFSKGEKLGITESGQFVDRTETPEPEPSKSPESKTEGDGKREIPPEGQEGQGSEGGT